MTDQTQPDQARADATQQDPADRGNVPAQAHHAPPTQAAALYGAVHGTAGPDDLPVALAKLATIEAQRAVRDYDLRRFGQGGRT